MQTCVAGLVPLAGVENGGAQQVQGVERGAGPVWQPRAGEIVVPPDYSPTGHQGYIGLPRAQVFGHAFGIRNGVHRDAQVGAGKAPHCGGKLVGQ